MIAHNKFLVMPYGYPTFETSVLRYVALRVVANHCHHGERERVTSDTWQCLPCQDRFLLWSRPSSFLVVSTLS